MSRISDWVGYRALVVGCGSIGRRHARNLKLLGVRQLDGLLVHSATEYGDQILKFFLAAHDKPHS